MQYLRQHLKIATMHYMERRFKYLIIATCLIFGLFVSSLVMMRTLVNPEQIKHQISKQVYKHTGKTLAIRGKLTWSFLPWTGVALHDIALYEGAELITPLLTVNEIDIKINLYNLFRRQVRISGVKIVKPHVVFADASRKQSPEKLQQVLKKTTVKALKTHQAKNEQPKQRVEAKPASKRNAVKKPYVAMASSWNFDISQGRVDYIDSRNKKQLLRVKNIHIYANGVSDLSHPFTVRSHASLDSPNTVPVQITTTSLIKANDQHLLFNNTRLSADIPQSSKQFMKLIVTGNVDYDVAAKQVQTNDLALNANSLRIQGHLVFNMQQATPTIQGHLELLPLNLNAWLQDMNMHILPQQSTALSHVHAKITFPTDQTPTRFALELDQSQLTGSLTSPEEDGQPYELLVSSPKWDLSPYISPAQPLPPKPSGKTRWALLAKPPISPDAIKAKHHASQLEQAWLAHWLTTLHLKGKLSLGMLQARGMQLSQVAIPFQLMQGQLALDPVTANLYGGHITGTLAVNAQQPILTYRLKTQAKHVQLQKFLAATYDKSSPFTGVLEWKADLASEGMDTATLIHKLDGKVHVNTMVSHDMGKSIDNWLQQLHRVLSSPLHHVSSHKPTVHEAKGTLTINQGIARCDDLVIASPSTLIRGHGSLDLFYLTLDYMLDIEHHNMAKNVFSMPMKLTGPIQSPSIQVDIKAVPKQVIRNGIRSLVKPLKELLH